MTRCCSKPPSTSFDSFAVSILGRLASHVRQVLSANTSTQAETDAQCGLLQQALDAGDITRAAGIAKQLPAQNSPRPDLLVLRGRLAHAQGDLDQALQHFQAALVSPETVADAHFWCAGLHMQQGREAEALRHAQNAESLRPGNAQMLALIGAVRHHQGDVSAACAAFASALSVDAENTNALRGVASICLQDQRWAEAAQYYRCLLAVEPGAADVLCSYANALLAQGRETEAWPLFARAITVGEGHVNVHRDYGVALFRDGRLTEARARFEAGLRVKGDDAMLHLSHAVCELIENGNSPAAWDEYEWRRALAPAHFALRSRPWDGEVQAGRRILIYPEQGLGDLLLFARYIPKLADHRQHTVLQMPPALARLMRMSAAHDGWPVAEWVESAVRLEQEQLACDFEMALLSAQHLRGFAVEKAAAPYLHVDQALSDEWSLKLGGVPDHRLRVGLVWAGNPVRKDDYLRSIPTAQLAPLAALKDVAFVSLQMDAQPQHKSTPLPFEVIDPTPDIRDFADTAAIMRNLDLVLSIDTVAAHLAGAMAVPCWLLLSRVMDWRWEMGGVEQPWFAHHRSFRVAQQQGWEALMHRVVLEIDQQREALLARRVTRG